jgi:GNAT superfamily N-acetyltransferase
MMRPYIDVIPSAALGAQVHAEILDLCSKAYEEDFAPYLDLLTSAVHVILRDQKQLIAHAAWIERDLMADHVALRTAFIEAVAVTPSLQRQGYGSKIMSALPPLLSHFDLAALSPSDEAFYRRLGWETWEGPLSYQHGANQIPTPDECVMIYRLPRTPVALNIGSSLKADWRDGDIW